MNLLADLALPLIVVAILGFALCQKVPIIDAFVSGAKKGLETSFGVFPTLLLLMTCIGMFRSSGALDILVHALHPLAEWVGVPEGVLPLALLRPLSGSGSLTIFQQILTQYGPDSFTGRVASIMQGSTETTFYTIAVYYGAAKVRQTRYTAACALAGDLVSFFISGYLVLHLFS